MKKNFLNTIYIPLSGILLLFVLLISCQREPAKTEKKETLPPKIYATIFPIEHFTKQLLPDVEIESLLPSGTDPHHFEPSLKDIQKLYTADMIIYLGNTDVDRWLDKIRDEIVKKNVKVVRLQDSISFSNYTNSKEVDPHIWLDPLISLKIIEAIKDKLIELSPQKKDLIEKNFLTFAQEIKKLDNLYSQSLSKCALKKVVSTHEFLNYLGRRYGFEPYFIVHEPDEEPSPKKIKKLKDLMNKNSIQYILTENEGDKIAKSIAQETNAKILSFNTFHQKTDKSYIKVMEDNLKALTLALKCEN